MIPTTPEAAAIHAYHCNREEYTPDIEMQEPRISAGAASAEIEEALWESLVVGGAPVERPEQAGVAVVR